MTYTAIPDGDVDAESPGTTTLITLLRDNPIAITQGDAGAPNIIAAAIATDAVETLKIKDLNVTAAKLATDSVETAKIKNSAVTNAKIGPLAVTPFKIATDAVETAKIKNSAVIFTKIADGNITKAKLDVTVHRVLFSDITEVGSVGSGEDDLMTYTMPANTMANNGDRLRITAYFKGGGLGDFATLKIHFGATARNIFSGLGPSSADFGYKIVVDVIRLTSNSQKMVGSALTAGGANLLPAVNPAESNSGTIIIKFTGENTSNTRDNAVIQQYMQIESVPAG